MFVKFKNAAEAKDNMKKIALALSVNGDLDGALECLLLRGSVTCICANLLEIKFSIFNEMVD